MAMSLLLPCLSGCPVLYLSLSLPLSLSLSYSPSLSLSLPFSLSSRTSHGLASIIDSRKKKGKTEEFLRCFPVPALPCSHSVEDCCQRVPLYCLANRSLPTAGLGSLFRNLFSPFSFFALFLGNDTFIRFRNYHRSYKISVSVSDSLGCWLFRFLGFPDFTSGSDPF